MSRSYQGDNMKIEHITYEESRPSRSTSHPGSATQKVKDYFSSHNSRISDQGNPGKERTVIMWPRSGNVTPSDNLPEMTAYLTQQSRAQKEARKEKEAKPGTDSSGSCLPLTLKEKKTLVKPAPSSFHPLRHKGKLSVTREKPSRTSSAGETPPTGPEHNPEKLQKLQKLQRAIKDGKFERVAPRPTLAEAESRLAHPRPTQNPFLSPSSVGSSTANFKNSKTKSTSSKVAEYIGTSADILDETRRDLQLKFRPPFEYLNYPTFSSPRRTSVDSEHSDVSFYCKGEDGDEEKNHSAVQALKARQFACPGRRLSGEGTDPWTQPAPENCRLCKKPGVGGVRGLCSQCEKDFMRPKVPALGLSYATSSSSSEGVKPTPPLKDRKTLPMREPVQSRKSPHIASEIGGDLSVRPRVPPKHHPKYANVESKPTLHDPTPVRQISQSAEIEEVSEDDERYRRWQTKSMREEFERTQGMFGRWSDAYENGEVDDRTLLIKESEEDAMKRNDSFYEFWEDVLEGHR